MRMRLLFAIALFGTCVHAQQTINFGQVKAPVSGGTTGRIDFFEHTNGYRVSVQASLALAQNLPWKWPTNTDTAGDCLVSAGGGQWNPGTCAGGLTVPITFSGTSASTILTVTQLGSGDALDVNGLLNVTGAAVASGNITSSAAINGAIFRRSGTTFVDSGGYRVIGGTNYVIDTNQDGFLRNLTATGTGTFGSSLLLDQAASTNRNIDFLSASSLRWIVRTNNATESGSNAGSNFDIRRHTDTGTPIDNPLSIARATGVVTINDLNVVNSCTGCGTPTPPVTLSASSASPILTLTQTGAGDSLDATGPVSITGTITASGQISSSSQVNGASFRRSGTTFVDSGGYRVIGGTNYVIDTSQNASFAGLAITGSFSGTHAQNVGTGDIASFLGLSIGSSGVSTTGGMSAATLSADSGNFTVTGGGGGGNIGTNGTISSGGTITAANRITSSGGSAGYRIGGTTVIDASTNGNFAGLAISGAFTGTHAQNVGTPDSPAFWGINLTSYIDSPLYIVNHIFPLSTGGFITLHTGPGCDIVLFGGIITGQSGC